MSDLIDKARLEVKFGDYAVASSGALSDPLLLPRVQGYRRQSGARMMALDRHAAQRKIPVGEYHISRKIDGEFNVLIWKDGVCLLLNPGGTVRIGLPVLQEAEKLLKAAKVKEALVPCELWVRREDKERPRVHDVSRVARKPESAAELESLQLAVFDVIEVDGDSYGQFSATWKKIEEMFGEGEKIQPVEGQWGSDSKEILSAFEKWVDEEGGEGVVARSDGSGSFKVKPRHTLDVVVVGYAEGTDDRAGMLHDLLLAIPRIDGSFQILGRVGGGFSDDDRRNFLSDFADLDAASEYAEVNSDRVAYKMVRPERVIEISCLDLVSQTTRGGTIDRMVLNWEEETWKTVRRLPLVSLISPQFIRLRDDKSATPEDARFSQITDLVEVSMATATANDLKLPGSEIQKREVVTKELKGRKMVRKLMLWKTNKDERSDEYPAYVVHLTDFSPNRKDPMKREIRVSDSKEQIEALYHQLKEKFFVGGWKTPGEE
jgi:hypothetical protein